MHIAGYLVETQTSDGLRLNGFLQKSKEHHDRTSPTGTVGATLVNSSDDHHGDEQEHRNRHGEPTAKNRSLWILVHGVAGNFYNSSLLSSLAKTLREEGDDTLLINTRGRDPIAYLATNSGPVRIGAAYEAIADSQLDLSAWLDFARSHGYEHISLLGHSLGAVKSLFYATQSPRPAIHKLVLVSPPRLNSEELGKDSKYAAAYQTDFATAKSLVDAGKPEALMTIRFPQPMLISAATFLDKYGSGNLYDYFQVARTIGVPCLWCFGEWEVRGPRSSFKDCDQLIAEMIQSHPHQSLHVVAKADHSYTQARPEVQKVLRDWVRIENILT